MGAGLRFVHVAKTILRRGLLGPSKPIFPCAGKDLAARFANISKSICGEVSLRGETDLAARFPSARKTNRGFLNQQIKGTYLKSIDGRGYLF
jgi:hypothetical protein